MLDRPTLLLILWIGASLTLFGLVLFFFVISRTGDPVGARTMLFTFIVTAEMGVLQVIRGRTGLTPWSNVWLVAAVVTSLLLHLLVLYTPLSGPFDVRGLSGEEWILIVGATAAFLLLARVGSRLFPDSHSPHRPV